MPALTTAALSFSPLPTTFGFRVPVYPYRPVECDVHAPAALIAGGGFVSIRPEQIAQDRSWKPDVSRFRHPFVGRHLPLVVSVPESVLPEVELTEKALAEAEVLVERYVESVAQGWAISDEIFSHAEEERIAQAVRARVLAMARLGTEWIHDVDSAMMLEDSYWGSFAEWNETTTRLLSTPMESALNHLHGMVWLYAHFDIAGLLHREDFFVAGDSDRQLRESFEEALDADFLLQRTPGDFESTGGLEHRLVARGRPGEDELVMKMGVLRRPEGFAVVNLQGGNGIGRKRMLFSDGVRRPILDRAQRQFGEDLTLWFARFVLARLRQEDPASPIFWRRGNRYFWPLLHVNDPERPSLPIRAAIARVGFPSLPALVDRREAMLRQEAASGGIPSERLEAIQQELQAIQQLHRVTARYDRIGKELGFISEDEDSPWLILPAGRPVGGDHTG